MTLADDLGLTDATVRKKKKVDFGLDQITPQALYTAPELELDPETNSNPNQNQPDFFPDEIDDYQYDQKKKGSKRNLTKEPDEVIAIKEDLINSKQTHFNSVKNNRILKNKSDIFSNLIFEGLKGGLGVSTLLRLYLYFLDKHEFNYVYGFGGLEMNLITQNLSPQPQLIFDFSKSKLKLVNQSNIQKNKRVNSTQVDLKKSKIIYFVPNNICFWGQSFWSQSFDNQGFGGPDFGPMLSDNIAFIIVEPNFRYHLRPLNETEIVNKLSENFGRNVNILGFYKFQKKVFHQLESNLELLFPKLIPKYEVLLRKIYNFYLSKV